MQFVQVDSKPAGPVALEDEPERRKPSFLIHHGCCLARPGPETICDIRQLNNQSSCRALTKTMATPVAVTKMAVR